MTTFKKETENKFIRNKKIITAITVVIILVVTTIVITGFSLMDNPNAELAAIGDQLTSAALGLTTFFGLFNLPMMALKIMNGLKATYITKQKMHEIEFLKKQKQAADSSLIQRKLRSIGKTETNPMQLNNYILNYCKLQHREIKGITFHDLQEILNLTYADPIVKVNSVVDLLKKYGVPITTEFEKNLIRFS
jgi:hypothetical protein